MMKAIRIPKFGDHEVLSYEDVSLPEPKAGEVRVKQAAVGVNFIDIYHRKGLYPNNLPFTAGSEGSGPSMRSARASQNSKWAIG
jgi:NADPH2:quinone reductase